MNGGEPEVAEPDVAPSARPTRRPGVVLLWVPLLAAAAVLLRIDAALAGPDRSGWTSGFTAVASPTSWLDPVRALAVTRSWPEAAAASGGLSAGELVARYAAVDAVLAVCLALLLTAGARPATTAVAGWARLLPPTVLAGAYLLADWGETLYLSWVWARPLDGAPLASSDAAAMQLVGVLSTLKWVALAAAVVQVIRCRRAGRRRAGRAGG